MYVLHHDEYPQIYAELPKDPTISALVDLWKGATKIRRHHGDWPLLLRWGSCITCCTVPIGSRTSTSETPSV